MEKGIIVYLKDLENEWTEAIRPEDVKYFCEGKAAPFGLLEQDYGYNSVDSNTIVTRIEKPVCYVIINEQHTMKKEQKEILEKEFKEIEFIKVPSEGWTLSEMRDIFQEIRMGNVVFISPVPAMMKMCSGVNHLPWYVFHNDQRTKKELPNGKIISVVADTGWKLV